MNLNPLQCPKDILRRLAFDAGACAVGFARAAQVDDATVQYFRSWLAAGCHGDMAYMARYEDIRLDPRLLLDGAKTIVSLAFSYSQPDGYHHPFIADYALGCDYHEVLHRRLQPLADALTEWGATARVCVDSAPILERYWAVRAGVGFVGCNRQLIVPSVGSTVFLAEIITTFDFEPDSPCELECGDCGKCRTVCPCGALNAKSGFDARRCVSYLTIEHRGEIPADTDLGPWAYGCDACQRVCTHNVDPPVSPIAEFVRDENIASLDKVSLAAMSGNAFRRLTQRSAIKRLTLKQLKRNLSL